MDVQGEWKAYILNFLLPYNPITELLMITDFWVDNHKTEEKNSQTSSRQDQKPYFSMWLVTVILKIETFWFIALYIELM